MTIFYLALFLITVISDDKKCLSHDPCQGFSGKRCSIADYFQIIIHIVAGTSHRYYPFCIKVDEFSELYLEDSYEWLTSVGNITHFVESNPPTMSIILPKGGDVGLESKAWPVLGLKNGKFTWPRLFTTTLNMLYGKFKDKSEDTFKFESMCNGDGKCNEFSKKYDDDYNCVKGQDKDAVTCTVVDGSDLQEKKLRKDEDWPSGFVPDDVKLYIVFSGSDNKGSAFKSASYLPSRFKMLSFGLTNKDAYKAIIG